MPTSLIFNHLLKIIDNCNLYSKLTQIQFQFQIQILLPFSKMFQNVPKVSKIKQTQFKSSEDPVKGQTNYNVVHLMENMLHKCQNLILKCLLKINRNPKKYYLTNLFKFILSTRSKIFKNRIFSIFNWG